MNNMKTYVNNRELNIDNFDGYVDVAGEPTINPLRILNLRKKKYLIYEFYNTGGVIDIVAPLFTEDQLDKDFGFKNVG